MKSPAASAKRPYAKRAVVPVSIRLEENLMPLAECGCWIWMGHLSDLGYGKMKIDGKAQSVHRVSWTLNRNAIPDGVKVLHSCDIRCCFNPDHLFLGSQADNVADMISKNRGGDVRGERNGNAKITAIQADEIRNSPLGTVALGKIHGIGRSMVSNIKRGENWND